MPKPKPREIARRVRIADAAVTEAARILEVPQDLCARLARERDPAKVEEMLRSYYEGITPQLAEVIANADEQMHSTEH